LYSFQHRELDPTLGRWIQQDPAGYVDGKNLYQFVSGTPVVRRDPLGLAGEDDTYKIIKTAEFEQRDMETGEGHHPGEVIGLVTIQLKADTSKLTGPWQNPSAKLKLTWTWHAKFEHPENQQIKQPGFQGVLKVGKQFLDDVERAAGGEGKLDYKPGPGGGTKDSETSGEVDLGEIQCGHKLRGTVGVVRKYTLGDETRESEVWKIDYIVTLSKGAKFDPEPTLTYTKGSGGWGPDPTPVPKPPTTKP
jgi:uncharacterized protein RhaS with RHS repeats